MTATPFPRHADSHPELHESLLELIRRTSTILPDDVVRAVSAARTQEAAGSIADVALDVIGCNIGLARENSLPLCQDTRDYGIRGVIGKGGMGEKKLSACQKYGAVYLHAIGGAAGSAPPRSNVSTESTGWTSVAPRQSGISGWKASWPS